MSAAAGRPSRVRAAPARLEDEQAALASLPVAKKPRQSKRARSPSPLVNKSTAAKQTSLDAAAAAPSRATARAAAAAVQDEKQDEQEESGADDDFDDHEEDDEEEEDEEEDRPAAKKRKSSQAKAAASASSDKAAKKKKKGVDVDAGLDLSAPYDDSAPVFDCCNEVRRKIRALLHKGDITISAFLKACGGVNSNSYRQFMAMKGPMQGGGNRLYPAAYHYFERRRVAAGKAKCATRLASEAAFPHGYPLQSRTTARVWHFAGERPVMNRIGQIRMVPEHRHTVKLSAPAWLFDE